MLKSNIITEYNRNTNDFVCDRRGLLRSATAFRVHLQMSLALFLYAQLDVLELYFMGAPLLLRTHFATQIPRTMLSSTRTWLRAMVPCGENVHIYTHTHTRTKLMHLSVNYKLHTHTHTRSIDAQAMHFCMFLRIRIVINLAAVV